jgi:nucleoside-diphosphate-sugar epimerase
MRVFLAGATGVIGRPLVEGLLALGHDVAAMTRSPEHAAALRERGVEAFVCDAFDVDGVHRVLREARPEVVVHQLTALPRRFNPRRYAEQIEPTNRLRRQTGPLFVAAAREAGARRIVAQSIAFVLRPDGPWVQDESGPLWLDAPPAVRGGVEAVQTLERAVVGAEGIEGVVLRYGFFYGDGTAYGRDGDLVAELRRRRLPVVRPGTGHFSFVHVDDAVEATILALDRGPPGVYNVTDDEPVPARVWVPAMAEAVGAKRPRTVPVWLARLLAGPMALAMINQRGASNAKARRELGWAPRYPTYREGFPATLGAAR